MEPSVAKTSESKGSANIHRKWGKAVSVGFQAVPDVLLKNQHELRLSAIELVVLLNILMHWWYSEFLPFPRPTAIAKRMGVGVRTVQRATSKLEKLGLITRKKGKAGETYVDPELLVQRLEQLAEKDPRYMEGTNKNLA